MKAQYYFVAFSVLVLTGCQRNTPEALFAIVQPGACYAPCSVSFDNQSSKATGYYWDFGDGTRSEEYEPDHVFEKAGTYKVVLRVENYGHGDDSYSLTVTIEDIPPDPVASFTVSPSTCNEPCPVVFTNTSQHANKFEWDFGDGSPKDTISHNPSHVYAKQGSYTAKLKAYGAGGKVANATATVKVNAPTILPPVAAFDVSQSTCVGTCTVSFYNKSTNGPNTYQWNFDDGKTSSLTDPTHTFSPGSYKVTLTASNAGGSSTATKNISVQSSGPSSIKFNYATIWSLPNLTWGYYDPDGYPDVFINIYYWSDSQQDWVFEAQTYYHENVGTLPISLDADPNDCWIRNLDINHRIEVLDYDGQGVAYDMISSGEFIPNDHINSNINFYYNSNGELAYTLYLTW